MATIMFLRVDAHTKKDWGLRWRSNCQTHNYVGGGMVYEQLADFETVYCFKTCSLKITFCKKSIPEVKILLLNFLLFLVDQT